MGVAIDPLHLSPTMVSRKLQVLHFIEQFFAVHGVGPSLGEIGRALGVTPKRVHDLVTRLAYDGRIQRQRGKARSIRPLTAREEAIRQLRDDGFIIDEDILSIRTPLTNAGLHLPPDLDHIPDRDGDGDGQNGEGTD